MGDTGDISLLSFLASANFWAISAILGHFWAILGHFRSFLVLFFVAKYASVLFKSLFATLNQDFVQSIEEEMDFHSSRILDLLAPSGALVFIMVYYIYQFQF